MKTFVLVENGKVIETATSDSVDLCSPPGNWVDVTNATPTPQMDWGYVDGVWIPSPDEPAPPPSPTITTAAFVELFTPAEYMAAEAFVGVDPVTTQLYKVAELQGTVDMASPKVTEIALPNFVTLGVLTQARADEIAQGWAE